MKSQADLDNHSRQLNSNDITYWKSRGYDSISDEDDYLYDNLTDENECDSFDEFDDGWDLIGVTDSIGWD